MANFKVGQRVKVIRCDPPSPGAVGFPVDYTGREGKVTDGMGTTARNAELTVPVLLDGEWQQRWFRGYELAPLTDPKADAFIESIKRLEREPKAVPLPEKERL